MKRGRKVIAVTPAGRRKYLEVLAAYIQKLRPVVDEWHLWLNTTDAEDISYCLDLEVQFPGFVKTWSLDRPYEGVYTIYTFFKNAMSSDSVYIRFDDDICFVEVDAFESFLNFRLDNPQYFLVYANIVNNAIITHLYQRQALIPQEIGFCSYNSACALGWADPRVAEVVHRSFLNALSQDRVDEFKRLQLWLLREYEGCSINCISWLGEDLAAFGGAVDREEELWLTTVKPRLLKRPNCIYGRFLVAHFAFFTQRKHLETTALFDLYRTLAIS